MSDDKQYNINIETDYDSTGIDVAIKKTQQLNSESKKTSKESTTASSQMSAGWQNLATKLIGVVSVATAAYKAFELFKTAVANTAKEESSARRLQNALDATGRSAIWTTDQLKAMHSQLSGGAIFGSDELYGAQSILVTFDRLGRDVLPNVLQVAADLSSFLGGDIEQNARRLGAALNDPRMALSMLNRELKLFSESEQKHIIYLQETNRLSEAQTIILDKLNSKIGGAAAAELDTYNGKLKAMKNSFNDLTMIVGEKALPIMKDWLDGVTAIFKATSSAAAKESVEVWKNQAKELERNIILIQAMLAGGEELYENGKKIALTPKSLIDVDAAQQELTLLQKQLAALREKISAEEQANAELEKQQQLNDQLEQQRLREQAGREQNEKIIKAEMNTRRKANEDLEKQIFAIRQRYAEAFGKRIYDISQIYTKQQAADMQQSIEAERAQYESVFARRIQLYQQDSNEFKLAIEERKIALTQLDELEQSLANQTQERTISLTALDKFFYSNKMSEATQALTYISTLQNAKTREMAVIGKTAAIANATISTYLAANQAYSAMAGIPIVGPALGAIAAAAAIAAGLANVAQISGVQLAEGGLVQATAGGIKATIGEGSSDEAVIPLNDSRATEAIAEAIGGKMGGQINLYLTVNGDVVERTIEQITEAVSDGIESALQMSNAIVKAGEKRSNISV